MNKGFSITITVIGLAILIPVILIMLFNSRLNNQRGQIKGRIADLHISAAPQSEQCGGDGVDSKPWCDYKYPVAMSEMKKILESAGYSLNSNVSYSNGSFATYKGGNPEVTFRISSNSGITSLYGELSQ